MSHKEYMHCHGPRRTRRQRVPNRRYEDHGIPPSKRAKRSTNDRDRASSVGQAESEFQGQDRDNFLQKEHLHPVKMSAAANKNGMLEKKATQYWSSANEAVNKHKDIYADSSANILYICQKTNSGCSDQSPSLKTNSGCSDQSPSLKTNSGCSDQSSSLKTNSGCSDQSPSLQDKLKDNDDQTGAVMEARTVKLSEENIKQSVQVRNNVEPVSVNKEITSEFFASTNVEDASDTGVSHMASMPCYSGDVKPVSNKNTPLVVINLKNVQVVAHEIENTVSNAANLEDGIVCVSKGTEPHVSDEAYEDSNINTQETESIQSISGVADICAQNDADNIIVADEYTNSSINSDDSEKKNISSMEKTVILLIDESCNSGGAMQEVAGNSVLNTNDVACKSNQHSDAVLVNVDTKQEQEVVVKHIAADSVQVTVNSDGWFTCSACDYKTDKRTNWYKHKKKHVGAHAYPCDQCLYVAKTNSNLRRHKEIHNGTKRFMCEECDLTFRQKIHLVRHVKYKHEVKNIKCLYCDFVCGDLQKELTPHIQSTHPSSDIAYTSSCFPCNECDFVCSSRRDLQQHLKFHKPGPELKLYCQQCSFVTDCESRLRRHQLIHTQEKPYSCGNCDYSATQKVHILRHMKTKHGLTFSSETSKKDESDILDGKDREENEKGVPVIKMTEVSPGNMVVSVAYKSMKGTKKRYAPVDHTKQLKPFACTYCTMRFTKLLSLYKHMNLQHKELEQEMENDMYRCVLCDYKNNKYKNLLVHMRKHNFYSDDYQIFHCIMCTFKTHKRSVFVEHMIKQHNMQEMTQQDGVTKYVFSYPETWVKANTAERSTVTSDSNKQLNSEVQTVSITNSTDKSVNVPVEMAVIPVQAIHSGLNTTVDTLTTDAVEGLQALSTYSTATIVDVESAGSGTSNISPGRQLVEVESEQTVISEGSHQSRKVAVILKQIVPEVGNHNNEEEEDLDSIQMSEEQFLGLNTGDVIQINGRAYLVECQHDSAT